MSMKGRTPLLRPRKGDEWVAVRIDDFIIDDEIQIRDKEKEFIVAKYMTVLAADTDKMPPITLARIPVTGTEHSMLYLVDGFHRVAAAKQIGISQMKAIIIDVGSLDEARWLSGKTNLKHGEALTPAEVRQAFRAFIKAKLHVRGRELMSYQDIANALENTKSKSTIFKWMNEDFPKVAAKMSAGNGMGTEGVNKRKGITLDAADIVEKVEVIRNKIKAMNDDEEFALVCRHVDKLYEEVRRRASDNLKKELKGTIADEEYNKLIREYNEHTDF